MYVGSSIAHTKSQFRRAGAAAIIVRAKRVSRGVRTPDVYIEQPPSSPFHHVHTNYHIVYKKHLLLSPRVGGVVRLDFRIFSFTCVGFPDPRLDFGFWDSLFFLLRCGISLWICDFSVSQSEGNPSNKKSLLSYRLNTHPACRFWREKERGPDQSWVPCARKG